MGEGRYALLTDEQEIFLEAPPDRGDGLISFTRRYCGTTRARSEVARVNGHPRRLLKTSRYRVPLELLTADYQRQVLQTLFHEDRPRAAGWEHKVRDVRGSSRESLWRVALWFTGRGENYRSIRERNGLADDDLRPGQWVLVPAELLRPALRPALPALVNSFEIAGRVLRPTGSTTTVTKRAPMPCIASRPARHSIPASSSASRDGYSPTT